MLIETERLFLRHLTPDDIGELKLLLQDEVVMYAYEHAFSDNEVKDWLNRQLVRYKNDGYGLYAIILKQDNSFIGQCGLTVQDIGERKVNEIGYLLKQKYWHNGYAIESALGVKDYAFRTLGLNEVYCIIRDTNLPSINVAKKLGMSECGNIVKHYYNMDMPHIIYKVEKNNI